MQMDIGLSTRDQLRLLRSQIEQAKALAVELDLTLVVALLEHALDGLSGPSRATE